MYIVMTDSKNSITPLFEFSIPQRFCPGLFLYVYVKNHILKIPARPHTTGPKPYRLNTLTPKTQFKHQPQNPKPLQLRKKSEERTWEKYASNTLFAFAYQVCMFLLFQLWGCPFFHFLLGITSDTMWLIGGRVFRKF